MARGKPFSEAEKATLTALYAEGLMRPDIALRMGRPLGTIDNWCSALGLAKQFPRKPGRRHGISPGAREPLELRRAKRPEPRPMPPPPIAHSDFIRPLTRAELMAGR